jgi:hypothetical protein
MVDAEARHFVRQRAEHRCEYCRLPEDLGEVTFHVEHIVARQHQGGDELSNLALACDRCNLYKGPNLSTKVEGETVELFHPRQHKWSDHFAFVGPEIAGLTPTGQATAQLLKMNSPRRVAIRRRMLAPGETL